MTLTSSIQAVFSLSYFSKTWMRWTDQSFILFITIRPPRFCHQLLAEAMHNYYSQNKMFKQGYATPYFYWRHIWKAPNENTAMIQCFSQFALTAYCFECIWKHKLPNPHIHYRLINAHCISLYWEGDLRNLSYFLTKRK